MRTTWPTMGTPVHLGPDLAATIQHSSQPSSSNVPSWTQRHIANVLCDRSAMDVSLVSVHCVGVDGHHLNLDHAASALCIRHGKALQPETGSRRATALVISFMSVSWMKNHRLAQCHDTQQRLQFQGHFQLSQICILVLY